MACCSTWQCCSLFLATMPSQPHNRACSWNLTPGSGNDTRSSTRACHWRRPSLVRQRTTMPHSAKALPSISPFSNSPSDSKDCSSDDQDVIALPRSELVAALAITLGVCAVFLSEPAFALTQIHDKAGVEVDMTALALGPEGPLVEEFWENVTRYVAYFFTVATGGAYSIVKPITGLLRKPVTAFFVITALGGGAVITYLTLSAMLGLSEGPDQYQF